MPRVCTICTHPERAAIDAALVSNAPFRNIAERFSTSATALTRHKAEHVPARLAKAAAAKETAQADDLLSQVQGLRNKAISILLNAEAAGDLRTALLGIREARSCMELLAEMEGALKRNPHISITITTEWVEIRALLLATLAPYPDARAAVAQALLEVDDVSA